jgi:glycosyltransferase involved in cell wall biosynthesis
VNTNVSALNTDNVADAMGESQPSPATSPLVSICLLTYNRAGLLSRSIESLLAQTYKNFELIINDDCSPDNTTGVARDYERRDCRVRYYRNETNLRYAGNQNAAIRRASSEYIAIVHDGDIYRVDCVEKWVAVLIKHPAVGLVYNASDELDRDGRVRLRHRHPYPLIMSGKAMIDEMLRLYSSPIFGIVMLRKSVVMKVGEFDVQYPILSDVDMWMRLMMVTNVAYINEPFYQISPREADHVNAGVNWSILHECHRIFLTNAACRYADEPQRADACRLLLQRHFRRRLVRGWLWSLRKRKWSLAYDGTVHLVTHGSLSAKVAAQALKPFLQIASRRTQRKSN